MTAATPVAPASRPPALSAPSPRGRAASGPATPDLLRLLGGVVVLAAVLAAVLATRSLVVRSDASKAIADRDAPLLVAAQALHTALSDADASATAAFLAGGVEPAALRARYEAALAEASDRLAEVARKGAGIAATEEDIGRVSRGVPTYAGLVEAARADNRQGFPVGAAYLRQASALLRDEILPAVDRIAAAAARRLDAGVGRAAGPLTTGPLLFGLFLALAAVVLLEVVLTRRTNRILNLPMAAATVLGVVGSVVLFGLLGTQAAALDDAARTAGQESIPLGQARVRLLDARAAEGKFLIARGSGAAFEAEFQAALAALISDRGPSSSWRANRAALQQVMGYRTAHAELVALDDGGRHDDAVASALRGAAADRFAAADASLVGPLADAQRRFATEVADARAPLDGLTWAVPLACLLLAGLVLVGLRPRLAEYR